MSEFKELEKKLGELVDNLTFFSDGDEYELALYTADYIKDILKELKQKQEKLLIERELIVEKSITEKEMIKEMGWK